MTKFAALFSLAVSCSVVLATPTATKTVTVPISRKKLVVSDTKDFVNREQRRVASFGRSKKAPDGVNAPNANASVPVINGDVSYTASTTVNGQTFILIVDTGSSNTWVGAGTEFDGTGATDTGDEIFVEYGSGLFIGTEYIASVTLGDLTVPSQGVGDAELSEGFDGVDGIIGFGPVDLTEGTVDGVDTVPTFLDNLFADGTISTEVLGVSFAPESGSDIDDENGELTIGGIDSTKFSGTPTFAPVSQVSPFSFYWGVDTDSISYGDTELEGAASAIVDTGTTLIYVPTDAYDAFLSAAGGTTDSSSGLAAFTSAPTEDFTISIGGTAFPLTPAQYLIPEAQYANFGLDESTFYAWVNDGGDSGVDFIIGQKFLENYYAIFDTTNSQIGFAPSTA